MSLKLPNVEGILAVDNQMGLAKQNVIPWKNKTDLAFFKAKTINQVIVMGSTTLLSLPKAEPLKDRINIVITNNFDINDIIILNNPSLFNIYQFDKLNEY